MGFFLGTQERVRNSRGKRAISVRATEVLLYHLKETKRTEDNLMKRILTELCFHSVGPLKSFCFFSSWCTCVSSSAKVAVWLGWERGWRVWGEKVKGSATIILFFLVQKSLT